MNALSTHWYSAGRTDTGKVRKRNEDAFLELPGRGLWVVADGMGGHEAGHLASQMIVEALQELELQGDFDERLNSVRRCLHWLNQRMGQALTVVTGGTEAIMGSTVVALLIHERRAACIWAGDSRCYMWRDGRLFQLSRDHSVREQLMNERKLTAREAQLEPGAHALTRALGGREPLRLEILELEVQHGDLFLLCSDGLYAELSDVTLCDALKERRPQRVLDSLFAGALRGRAGDNLTAVVIGR